MHFPGPLGLMAHESKPFWVLSSQVTFCRVLLRSSQALLQCRRKHFEGRGLGCRYTALSCALVIPLFPGSNVGCVWDVARWNVFSVLSLRTEDPVSDPGGLFLSHISPFLKAVCTPVFLFLPLWGFSGQVFWNTSVHCCAQPLLINYRCLRPMFTLCVIWLWGSNSDSYSVSK